MRLNPHSPSDNPMEQLLYCFGGDGDSGGGGSSADDADSMDSGYDTSTVGMGTNTDTNFGGGDGGSGGYDPGFDEGDVGDTGGFDPGFDEGDVGGGFDTGFGGRDGRAGAAGSNIDSLIEQSTAFGYGPNIQSTDLPSQAEVSAAIAAGIPGVQAQTTGFTAPSVTGGQIGRAPGDMGRDTSIERDIFGSGEADYTTQDIFEVDPTGLGLETRQERVSREKAEDTRAAARAAAVERARVASEQAQKEALQRTLGIPERDIALQTQLDEAMAPERARQAAEDALSAELDAEKAARESRTSAPESRGIDSLMGGTVFGVPDDLGPSEDIGMGQSAAVPGVNTNISGVTEVDATQQAADAARAATGIQSITDDQGNVVGVERSVNLGGGITQAELDQARSQGKAAQAGALDQRAKEQQERAAAAAVAAERTVNGVPVTDFSQPRTDTTPSFNPTVEVTNVSGPGRKEIDIADFQPTDYTAEDLAQAEREFDQVNLDVAQRDFDAARREAYGDKQFGFDTGLPGSVDIFGAKIPTGVGVVEGIADALFDPTSSAANAIAERGIKSVDGMSAEGTANYNPNGLEVVTAGGPLSEGGRTAAYDPSNNVVYDTSPFSGLNPFGEGVPDNIQDLYSRKNAIDDAERARQGGDGGEPIIPPLIDEDFIGEAQTPEREQFELGEYQYEPMDPVQISYTGIPTLAPQILRPSRMASRNIQPLYDFSGLGSLRRS